MKSSRGSHEEVRGERVGIGPSRATCQGYGTQMLIIHDTYLESYGPHMDRKNQRQTKKHLIAKK